jgi:hypothetical protein
MITALEAFASTKRRGTDPQVVAFYAALEVNGAAGQLAEYLLLAQRSHDRLKRVHDREYPDPDYERLLRSRNNFNIARLVEFCVQEQARLNIILKRFTYGIRITLRREATIRFRHVEDFWTGDDANLRPICEFCDRLVADERTANRLRKVQSWPTAV